MKAGKTIRVALDAALSLMIVFEMLIQFTGEFLHEVVGFAFFASIAMHIAISATWVRKTAHSAKTGNLTARRTALAVVACLLAMVTAVLGVSSIAISGILSSIGFVWPIGSFSMWASLHTLSSYALCAIVIVHLAMHWAFLASVIKVPYNPSRRRAISASVNAVAGIGVLMLGVTATGKMIPQTANTGQVADSTNGANNMDGSSSAERGTTPSDKTSSETSSSNTSGKSRRGESGRFGKRHKKGSDDFPYNSSPDHSTDAARDGSASPSSSADGTSTDTDNSSQASGICTLCRKQCPLSSPKCEKPYEAGLL